MRHQPGNGSSRFFIHQTDMGGWVCVYPDRTPSLPEELPGPLGYPRVIALARAHHLERPAGEPGQPVLHLAEAGRQVLPGQVDDQVGPAEPSAEVDGQERSPGRSPRGEDEGGVRVLDVLPGPDGVVGRCRLLRRVAVRDRPVFRSSAPRAPTSAGDAQVEGGIQRAAIHTGLPSAGPPRPVLSLTNSAAAPAPSAILWPTADAALATAWPASATLPLMVSAMIDLPLSVS
jgi:hypothetical protein